MPEPQKVRITATDVAFGGRSFIKLVIPGGPTRSFTPEKATVEATLTEEQIRSVTDTGLYEVEEAKQPTKKQSSSSKSTTATSSSDTSSGTSSGTTTSKDKE